MTFGKTKKGWLVAPWVDALFKIINSRLPIMKILILCSLSVRATPFKNVYPVLNERINLCKNEPNVHHANIGGGWKLSHYTETNVMLNLRQLLHKWATLWTMWWSLIVWINWQLQQPQSRKVWRMWWRSTSGSGGRRGGRWSVTHWRDDAWTLSPSSNHQNANLFIGHFILEL